MPILNVCILPLCELVTISYWSYFLYEYIILASYTFCSQILILTLGSIEAARYCIEKKMWFSPNLDSSSLCFICTFSSCESPSHCNLSGHMLIYIFRPHINLISWWKITIVCFLLSESEIGTKICAYFWLTQYHGFLVHGLPV